jgi:hypothetical protein
VADLHAATFSEEKLGAILDALAAGEPIPDPDPIEPPLLDEQGRNLSTDVLQVGVVPPELDGSGLDGEPLSTADLRGRPSVVLFWLPPRADGTTQDDVQPPNLLLDEIERRGDAIGALLVALGEPAPGDARRYLERGGYDVPVILDWTGELQDRWGLVFMTTLVLLDAHGRVVGYYGPDALGDPAGVLDTVAPTAS